MDVLFFNSIAKHIKKEINHKCKLSLSQTRILLFFDGNNNQPLPMGKLAKGLSISLSTLSRQLKQKKTQDYIEITRSDKDSSKIVCLSEVGLSKVAELKKALSEIEKDLFSKIDTNELTKFTQELKNLSMGYDDFSEMA
ncbi:MULTISPECIES: MarR family winged helix-turn-helix transcriptional regulator [Lactobacillus]|uniref:MarR family winged helix-turn-helix transcriptional regulator n=1 Tax=Lactobacillus TaxID=1578 RepID=UPI002491918A|nr:MULTISPECIES: MarR family transcriptional regulator [Lactobacillus]